MNLPLLPPGVTLLAVTKGQPERKVQEAFDQGVRNFGVNYVQEGKPLLQAFPEAQWHFIGRIQSRKVKELLAYHCIQSLSDLDIVAALNKRLEEQNHTVEGLIQINIGGETSKSGVLPQDLDAFWQRAQRFQRIHWRGLMVLPPALYPIEKRRPYFREARRLFVGFNATGWDCLSMGTSDDYSLAVEEGTTLVRLGTALFGPRGA